LLGFLLTRLGPVVKLVASFVLLGGVLAASYAAFTMADYVLPVVPPFLVIAGCIFLTMAYKYIIEEREKRKIKGSFKQYLSPKIIDIITKDPSKLKLGGEEREVTVFFLDIAGFTTMSEALKPTQLVEVMNQCLTCFSSVVLKHEGLINKYIGDCIMAFWNAPIDQPNHAAQACMAALDCINALPGLNKEFEAKGLPKIDCRVGINTGLVVVGNMGSHERFDYTVMGDPVNLASRLEGANKEYHSHIMVSDVTFEKAREHIEARDLDLIRVKGKKEPRRVFEVLCKRGQMSDALMKGRDQYHEALRLYRNGKFSDAIAVFEEVLHFMPDDHLTRKYLERARVYAITPPPNGWDGVFEMKSK
jgi:adenylate cyclase